MALSNFIDSEASPALAIPNGAPGRASVAVSSQVYTFDGAQRLIVWNCSGNVVPSAAGGFGQLTVGGARIIAELFADTAATLALADVVLAVAPGALLQSNVAGVSIRSDFRGDSPIFEIDSTYAFVGNNPNVSQGKTAQAVFFSFEVDVTNADAATPHAVDMTLTVELSIEQLSVGAK